MPRRITFLLTGAVALLAAAPAGAATVSVQIEGKTAVRGATTVQTPATVSRDGNTCPGNTAIGALDAVTGGNWSGTFAFENFAPGTILGETHVFGSGTYWAVYVNGLYQNVGACQATLQDGDQVLWYDAEDEIDPAAGGGYGEPLTVDPPTTTVTPGVPFQIGVRESTTTFDDNFTGTTAITAAAGATVTAGGVSATTDAAGVATLTLPTAGAVEVVATKGDRAPDRITLCATTGADGACGTTTPPLPAPVPDTKAAYGFITSVEEGQTFRRGPRELAGRVDPEPSGIADVKLRLTRRDAGKCTTYSATRERFVAMQRCGAAHGTWFSVGKDASWRYLLPERLGAGRYVLDVEVTDGAGNKDDSLARGRNRVVFQVG